MTHLSSIREVRAVAPLRNLTLFELWVSTGDRAGGVLKLI
jgi:hypothetical protein